MTAKVNADDLWTMYLSTLRYSLGRSTYIVTECTRLYNTYKEHFSPSQRSQVAHEIQSELSRAERAGTTVGMDMDHSVWVKFANQINSEPW